jgi:hypothetical protein
MKRGKANMINLQKSSGRVRSAIIPVAMLAIWVMNGTSPIQAQQSTQPTFPSAADASKSLFQAVQGDNEDAIANILGGPTDLTSPGERGQDRLDRELFAQRYQEMHRLGREPDGSMTLYIGAENWPFPIPLVEKNGAWHFDSEAGLKEVLFRRIGENEFTAIATCHEFLAAEKNYRPPSNTEAVLATSPASLVAKAASGSTGGDPVLFHGYYFKVLTRDTKDKTAGGFAFIAYPAEYRSSGVMTFIITKNGVVYEKDLGANTPALAGAMTAFHKDATWVAAEE